MNDEQRNIESVKEIKRIISISFDGFVPSELRDAAKISERSLSPLIEKGQRTTERTVGKQKV